jgi:hypothetical protein
MAVTIQVRVWGTEEKDQNISGKNVVKKEIRVGNDDCCPQLRNITYRLNYIPCDYWEFFLKS